MLKPKRGRPVKETHDQRQLTLDINGALTACTRSADARAMIGLMLSTRGAGEQWRGMIAVPPGTLAESVISQFRQHSNIPLEIPFFTLLSLISGHLLRRNVVVETGIGEIRPDIWTVILASSGAGKTYTQKTITAGLAEQLKADEFAGTGITSAAAFVNELEKTPRGVWIRDEFARFLKSIESEQGPLAEMKDYLLRLYDNDTITRSSKKETVSVENPAISILGLSVLETFKDAVSIESMLDGFAQRFSYVISRPDPKRTMLQHPLWRVDSSGWNRKWQEIESSICERYFVDDDELQSAFSASFQSLYNEHIPESFYRRLLWRAVKYALLYHVLRADKDPRLTPQDFGWAARAISIHVADAAWIIGDHNISGLERIIKSAESVIHRVKEKEGRVASARDLIQGVSAIKNVATAHQIMGLIRDVGFK